MEILRGKNEMSFRVYDTEQKKWIMSGVYLDPYENLYILEKKRFGRTKLVPVSDDRYVYHNAIGALDKFSKPIYEGDVVEAEVNPNEYIMLLVYYAIELTSYVLLDIATNTYYTINPEKCDYIRVMGNVFDTPLPEDTVGKVSNNEVKTDEKVSEEKTTEETVNN